jgi:predicted oxidoreductase
MQKDSNKIKTYNTSKIERIRAGVITRKVKENLVVNKINISPIKYYKIKQV